MASQPTAKNKCGKPAIRVIVSIMTIRIHRKVVAIAIICFVCVIALVTTIWVLRSGNDSKSTDKTTTSQGTDEIKNADQQNKDNQEKYTPPEITTENKPQEDGSLVIKEWDVQVTLPQSIKSDVSYFMNNRAEKLSGGPILADFLSQRFSSGDLKCSTIENDIPRSLVSIERLDMNAASASDFDPAPFKVIGSKGYRFLKTSCEDAISREGSAEDKALLATLKESISSTLSSAGGADN
jgi:hypothetical protein